jgi:hypothetical protein
MWHRSVAAAAAAVGLLIAATADNGQDPADDTIALVGNRGQATGYGPLPFTLKGKSVDKLYPGATRNIALVLTNPYSYPLKVTALNGDVVSSSRKRCKPVSANIRVRSFTGRLPVVVPPFSKASVNSIPVSMPSGASADCADTTFTLRLSGTATRTR